MKRLLQAVLLLLIFAGPAQAVITRTARGTGNDGKVSGTTVTVTVTAAAGSSLIVSAAGTSTTVGVTGVTWNSQTFNQDNLGTSGINCEIWSAHNVAAGTSLTLTVTWGSAFAGKAVTVSEISGWTTSGQFDQKASAAGTSVNADSGLTPTTTDANEYLAGNIAVNGPTGDTAPTWLNSFSAGQRGGTSGGGPASNITINEGFQIVSSAAQYKAAATLGTSRTWESDIATYKNAPAPGACTPTLALMGVGRCG